MAKSFNSSNSRSNQNSSLDPALASLRIPPHSIEAEQSVLGGLLLDNAAFDKIADLVGENDFYRDEHKRIYRQIRKLLEQSKPRHMTAEDIYRSLLEHGDEIGLAQHFEMLRHRGLADLELGDDFGDADLGILHVLLEQHLQDVAPRRVGDDSENIWHSLKRNRVRG